MGHFFNNARSNAIHMPYIPWPCLNLFTRHINDIQHSFSVNLRLCITRKITQLRDIISSPRTYLPRLVGRTFRATDYLTPRDTTSEKFASSYIMEKIPLVTITRRVRLLIYRADRINCPLEKKKKVSPAIAEGRETWYSGHVFALLSGPWLRILHGTAVSCYTLQTARYR